MPTESAKLKIYRSSAGSGKTYTLAREFLLMAIFKNFNTGDKNAFRHILAITFTNDAASEMKERVINFLNDISKGQGASLTASLIAELRELGCAIDEKKLESLASDILHSILHRYSDLSIQTIDSFTNSIANSFSRELGLPSSYEIHLDTGEKTDEAVDIFLEGIDSSSKESLKWLMIFLESKIQDNKTWNLAFNLKESAKRIVNEDVIEFLEKLKDLDLKEFDEARLILEKELAVQKKELKSKIEQIQKVFELNKFEQAHAKGKSKGYFSKLNTIKRVLFHNDKNFNINSIHKLIEEDKWLSTEGKKEFSDPPSFADQVRNDISELAEYYENIRPIHLAYSNIKNNIFTLALMREIFGILQGLKEDEEKVFISDLNNSIKNIVLNEPIPFLYEKAGYKYHNILIDEFQDTSIFQWINIIPLIQNSLANGHDCLLVGDVKQSIYAFRGGNSEILQKLPGNSIAGLESQNEAFDMFKTLSQEEELTHNWRSQPEIVKFNNDVFRSLINRFGEELGDKSIYYNELEQIAQKSGDAEVRIDHLDLENPLKEQVMNAKIELVLKYIEEKKHRFSYNEMAVLCRTNDEAKEIGEALINANIKVISNESLALENASVVKLLISVFKLIKEPANEEFRFDVFTELISLIKGEFQDWNTLALKIKNAELEEFIKYLIEDVCHKDFGDEVISSNAIDLANSWIRIFNLDQDEEQQVFIDFFIDLLNDKKRSGLHSLNDFLEFWDRTSSKHFISSQGDIAAVRIATIHKTKGLEFPLVIIPNPEISIESKNSSETWLEWNKSNPTSIPIASVSLKAASGIFTEESQEKERQDLLNELNLLYVAMTRAGKCLYIISSNYKSKGRIAKSLDVYVENTQAIETKEEEGRRISYYAKLNPDGFEPIEEVSYTPYNFGITSRLGIEKKLKRQVELIYDEEIVRSLDLGKKVHKALSSLKYLKDFIEYLDHLNLESKREELKKFQTISNFIAQNENLKKVYSDNWKVWLEKDLFVKGQLIRPDRIQESENRILVIDYKTGLQTDKNLKQLKTYIEALELIYPNHKVDGFLFYLNTLELINTNGSQWDPVA